ncbi:putative ferritin/ribonucleotide reductase [Collimonas arenae]|nr:putative ferritin/ribonucleotide reductase [Collimonas arenae]
MVVPGAPAGAVGDVRHTGRAASGAGAARSVQSGGEKAAGFSEQELQALLQQM